MKNEIINHKILHRANLHLSKRDAEILEYLMNKFGEGKSVVLKRALNFLYLNVTKGNENEREWLWYWEWRIYRRK